MFETLKSFLVTWNATKSDRQKLQHAYLVATFVIVMAAGITSLLDAQLGHNVVRLALLAMVVFLVNAISWNLMQSSLLSKLPRPTKTK